MRFVNSIRRSLSKMHIKYKLILLMYMIIIPMLLVIGPYLYIRSYNDTVDGMTSLYGNVVQTVGERVDNVQSDLLDLMTFLIVNSDVNRILGASSAESIKETPLIWEKTAPMDFISDMVSIKGYIRTFILFPENGVTPFYLSRDKTVHITNLDEIKETAVYKYSSLIKGDPVWARMERGNTGIYIQNKTDKLVLSRSIYNLNKSRQLGYIAIGMNVEEYGTPCQNALQQKNEGIVVLTNTGDELVRAGLIEDSVLAFITSEDFLLKGINEKNQYFEYRDHFVFCCQSSIQNNIVCYMVPKVNWLRKLQNAWVTPLLFGFAFLIALLPLSTILSTAISKPIQKLTEAMIKFKEGDFAQRVDVSGYDEIEELASCFNQMVIDIKELIDKNYVMVLSEKESELNALQAQINPHFLYNTLDSLYWSAVKAGSDKLAEDIYSLSKLFRLVLNQGSTDIPIEQEKELVYHYLQIQKMRFEKKLDYTITMDDEMLDLRIPKLILQPFVENAIVHGLEATGQKGMIEITGHLEGDTVVLQVRDNGVGISEEQLNDIFESDETKEYASQRIGHYAIRNVKQRLTLRYKDEFKLDIKRNIGKGTTVTIIIPVGYESEVTDNG